MKGMIKLKPCPFCADEVFMEDCGEGNEVSCKYCHLDMYDESEEDLIKRWNRRIIVI